MTKPQDEAARDARERADVQQVMARWGTLPVPVAPSDVAEQRRQRGSLTLRAAIGSAGRERQTRRMRNALVAVAAVALCAWGGIELFAPMQGSTRAGGEHQAGGGVVALVQGSSQVWSGQRGWVFADAGHTLAAGNRVRALTDPVDVRLARITAARVLPGSVLTIVTLRAHLQELRLESGMTDFEVDPQRQAEVVVQTADARVRVTGTAFSVTSGGGGTAAWSEVVVKRGHVEVTSDGKAFVLEAGESWSSRRHESEDERGGDALPSGEPSRVDAARTARSDRLSTAPSGSNALRRGDSDRPRDGALGSGGPAGDDATTLSEENRLFRAALSARNGGNGGRCVALLSDLLAQYPSSPLRQEAMVAHFRCLALSGDSTLARSSAARYLSEYPSGFARDEARAVLLDSSP